MTSFRPDADTLRAVAREAFPPPTPDARASITAHGTRGLVAAAALTVAVLALPGVTVGSSSTSLAGDGGLLVLLVGSAAATLDPAWRALFGRRHHALFGASAAMLLLPVLRGVDLMMGARFEIATTGELVAAAALVAVPVATFRVVIDILEHPDPTAVPD